jgi:hypothetical protein
MQLLYLMYFLHPKIIFLERMPYLFGPKGLPACISTQLLTPARAILYNLAHYFMFTSACMKRLQKRSHSNQFKLSIMLRLT